MSRRNPQRSSRPTNPIPDDSEWFPGTKYSACSIGGRIQILNEEAYPADLFAKADDLVIYSSFAAKGKKRRHHRVKPDWARASKPNPLTQEDGRAAANMCKPLFSGDVTWENVRDTVSKLQERIPSFRSDERRWDACLHNLLFRYSMIYRPTRAVRISKVTYDQQKASFGLKARRTIRAGTFIMETCSSMSLDVIQDQGPSIIEATSKQMAPAGRRLILGPFRLVNHDCDPNAQIYAIPKTHACVIMAIEDIKPQEEITVRYEKDGYYGAECMCKTCTGRDPSDLEILKRRKLDKAA